MVRICACTQTQMAATSAIGRGEFLLFPPLDIALGILEFRNLYIPHRNRGCCDARAPFFDAFAFGIFSLVAFSNHKELAF